MPTTLLVSATDEELPEVLKTAALNATFTTHEGLATALKFSRARYSCSSTKHMSPPSWPAGAATYVRSFSFSLGPSHRSSLVPSSRSLSGPSGPNGYCWRSGARWPGFRAEGLDEPARG